MFSQDFTLEGFEYFLLLLSRISAFVMVAPFFSNTNTPNRHKAGFSAVVAIMLYFTVPRMELDYGGTMGYAFVVIKEVICGLIMGYMTSCCRYIMLFAGTLMDMDIGISMAQVFDPSTGSQVAITGNLYNYMILLLLMVSDMHRYIFRAMVDSFTLIPLGYVNVNSEALYITFVKFMGDLFIIAFRIFLPVFACIMILNCVLGIMVKVSPQMNMFSIGIQLKMIVGFTVLFLTLFLLPNIANFVFGEMRTLMMDSIRAMM